MKRLHRPLLWSCTTLLLCLGAPAQAADADAAKLYRDKGCIPCHGAAGRTPLNENYPIIAGQPAGYLYNQMRDIKSGERNSVLSPVMTTLMGGVADDDMRLIAAWLAAQ